MEGVLGQSVDRIGGEPISARMARKAPIRHLDPTLLLASILLSAYGALMILSATEHRQEQDLDPNVFLNRQIVYIVVGFVVLLALATFDYRHLRGLAPLLYVGTIVALALVLSPLGELQGGARRWINFGAFQAQPSEVAKIAVIIAVAAFLAERKGDLRALDVIVACALIVLPSALIYFEPDLGTMMVFIALAGSLLLIGGAKLRHFVVVGAIGAIALFSVFELGMLKDYQVDRITAFLDSSPDVRSEGYNLTQSKIAIANGGIRGTGLREENTQTALDFVPEQHTDFIFTAVGEQVGLIGGSVLLFLFALLIWRGFRIAAMSRDLFGTLLASGIVALWSFQIFVNIGMTMGIMPITGIPLPFFSYGGSSLITNFAAVGILLNVHMRRLLS
jgi:rod shape determining protein RodA